MARSDVKVQLISDEVAADDDFIVTAARPNTAATLANSSFASGGARLLGVTTTGTGDNAKTNTIVGTDVFDNALTEVIVRGKHKSRLSRLCRAGCFWRSS